MRTNPEAQSHVIAHNYKACDKIQSHQPGAALSFKMSKSGVAICQIFDINAKPPDCGMIGQNKTKFKGKRLHGIREIGMKPKTVLYQTDQVLYPDKMIKTNRNLRCPPKAHGLR